MINVRISNFHSSKKCSVELENFEPKGGPEIFIKTFCINLRENLLEWNRNWEFGVGRMTFMGDEITLIQSEFPHVFSFDCRNETIANELKTRVVNFFESEIGQHFAQNP